MVGGGGWDVTALGERISLKQSFENYSGGLDQEFSF